jgi:galactonate dehydratase
VRIVDIRCHVVRIPRPDGSGALRNWIFVEVETDAGITGIGEATTEYHEMAVVAQVETELKPRLLQADPTDIERIWQIGYRDFWWRGGVVQTSAMSGIDQALWDIAGKAAGLPVFKLLGGKVRNKVRCYIRYGPEFHGLSLAEAVPKAIAMGFDAFKVGWGKKTEPYDMTRQVERAIADHEEARALLGPGRDLMIDAGGMFDSARAHTLIEKLRPLRMHFVEEPTNQDTLEPTLRLKRDFPDVPIALGERLATRWDFRPWFERQAIDVCQADVCHSGGISELMKIAHMAEVYGIAMAPHNPYGPVALAACGHYAAAIQNFDILEHCPIQPWFDRVQAKKVPIVAGHIDVGELARRPGLGIELDMDFVRAHSARHLPLAPTRYEQDDGSTPLL